MRDRFLLDPSIVFLNHGSFGACPQPVFAAYQGWQRELERQPVEFLGRRSAALLAEARGRLGAYLGARADDLVFLTNTTTGVNLVARSLDLRAGDEVLTTHHEYGACDNVWQHACARVGARYVRQPLRLPVADADTIADALWAGVTPRTRVLFFSHLTSTTALILPAARLCARARQAGILSVVDGAHAPGQLPLDLTAVGADVYLGNCHKWLCAPKGAAFIWARPEHHERFDATVISWGYSEGVSGHTDFDGYLGDTAFVRRHQWQGTRDIAAFLSVPAAIDFQAAHGWDAVRQRCHALAVAASERIGALTGLAPISGPEAFAQMVAVPLPPRDPAAMKAALYDRYRIEVPLTTHGGRAFVRVSFQGYNGEEDLAALVAALRALL